MKQIKLKDIDNSLKVILSTIDNKWLEEELSKDHLKPQDIRPEEEIINNMTEGKFPDINELAKDIETTKHILKKFEKENITTFNECLYDIYFLGNSLELIKDVDNLELIINRLASKDCTSAFYEAIIASCYKFLGYKVEFLKTKNSPLPDLHVFSKRDEFFVECKNPHSLTEYQYKEMMKWQKIVSIIIPAILKYEKRGYFLFINFLDDILNSNEDELKEIILTVLKKNKSIYSDSKYIINIKRLSKDVIRDLNPPCLFMSKKFLKDVYGIKDRYQFDNIYPFGEFQFPLEIDKYSSIFHQFISKYKNPFFLCYKNKKTKEEKLRNFKDSVRKAISQLPNGKAGVIHIQSQNSRFLNCDSLDLNDAMFKGKLGKLNQFISDFADWKKVNFLLINRKWIPSWGGETKFRERTLRVTNETPENSISDKCIIPNSIYSLHLS